MTEDPRKLEPPIAFIALHAVANGYVIHEHLESGGVRTKVYSSFGEVAVAWEAIDARLVRERKAKSIAESLAEGVLATGKALGIDTEALKAMAQASIADGVKSFFGFGEVPAEKPQHALGTPCPRHPKGDG